MNDRELLELAAKAAGVDIEPCTCSDERFPFKQKGGLVGLGHWQPLRDDGSALRLAVKLKIAHEIHSGRAWAYTLDDRMVVLTDEELGADPYAATRRAIVRAAAEIGKWMK